jgi:hypothetical protein
MVEHRCHTEVERAPQTLVLDASAAYILSGYGTGPQRHYPLEITIYFTDVSTNVTTPVNVFLRDDHTACVDTTI